MKISFMVLIIFTMNTELISSKKITGSPRLMNAKLAKKGKYPFMVNIWKGLSDFLCGGTIITSRWILTSADCVKDHLKDLDKLKIYAGNTVLSNGTQHRVRKGVVHPDFNSFQHDIGMFKVRKRFEFTAVIKKIQLNYLNQQGDADFTDCVVPGWGRELNNGEIVLHSDQKLRVVKTGVQKPSVCDGVKQPLNASIQVCTAGTKDMSGACNGDQGGPMICDDVQVGIVSYSTNDCGTKKWYESGTVVTRVSWYYEWIQTTTYNM